jgi:mycoredoxin-dependent peroxiredoxin
MSAQIGELAPDFTLQNQFGEEITLSKLRGRPVVLVFYPLSFSGVCTGEMCDLRDNLSIFEDAKVELIAISVDSKFVQAKFAELEGYKFSILSDFWPHGQVAQSYEIFSDKGGVATRATFVIDSEGLIAAKFTSAAGEGRNMADYKKAIELVS